MKKLICMIVALALLVTFAACGGAPAATTPAENTSPPASTPNNTNNAQNTPEAGKELDLPAVTLTCAGYLPSGNSFETYILNPFQDALNAAGANVTIEYFPGGTLLSGTEILDGMLNGVADMGHLAFAYFPGRFPVISFFEYPFQFSSASSAGYTMAEALELLQPSEINGFNLLVIYGSGTGAILSNKKLETVNDFKGLQIRANAIMGVGMSALGATPANIAMGECYEALRTGVVDAFVGIQEAGYPFKLQEVVDSFVYYPYCNSVMGLAISDAAWNKLTPDQQDIFNAVSEEVFVNSAASYCGVAGAATSDAVLAEGGEVYSFDDAVLEEMRLLLEPVITGYAETLDSQGYDGTQIMNLIKELSEKYNKLYPVDK